MKKLWLRFNYAASNINRLSAKIIHHGLQIACGLLIISILIQHFNTPDNFSFTLNMLYKRYIDMALLIACETIIAGILIDIYMIRNELKDK